MKRSAGPGASPHPGRWTTEAKVDAFVRRFRQRTLRKGEWTHEAHLIVGTWHVHQHGVDAAIALLRDRIRALNEAHGVANTDCGGYHETITRAYVHLIAAFLANCNSGEIGFPDCIRTLLRSPLAKRDVLLDYYSKDLLTSATARREWVDPDRQPLPTSNSPADSTMTQLY
jgi:hypothetical protein